MPTTPDGRWSPNNGDGYDLITHLAAMQVSNSTATTTAIAPLNSRGATVNSDAARNALFPSPVQGDRVYRSDLGFEQTYYAVYNAATNIGGASIPGWYPPVRMFYANRTGTQTVASWAILNAAMTETRNDGIGVMGNGAFTVIAPGTYQISASVYLTNGSNPNSVQITKNSTTADTANTIAAGIVDGVTARGGYTVSNTVTLAAGDVIRVLVFSSVANSVSTGVGNAGATFSIVRL